MLPRTLRRCGWTPRDRPPRPGAVNARARPAVARAGARVPVRLPTRLWAGDRHPAPNSRPFASRQHLRKPAHTADCCAHVWAYGVPPHRPVRAPCH
eukprot:scaffold187784_cov30-Tisochrysis_lutea.AAC.2